MKVKKMELGLKKMRMAMFIQGTGKKTNKMDLVPVNTHLAVFIQGTG